MIKLIAIDMDGTLLNSNHQITEEVKQTIKAARQQGIKIVLCTGRPLLGVRPSLKELDLLHDDDYVITFNGALIQKSKSEEVINHETLTYDDYVDLVALSEKLGLHIHMEDEHNIYTPNKNIGKYTVHESSLTDMPIRYRTIDELDRDMVISKVMMIDEPDLIQTQKEKIPESFYQRFEIVLSTPYFMEFLNPNASKGNALKRLADELHLTRDEVMAIGDNMNDLSMIQYAGTGVAMGNAVTPLKDSAQQITKTNDEHGVAYAIQTWAMK